MASGKRVSGARKGANNDVGIEAKTEKEEGANED